MRLARCRVLNLCRCLGCLNNDAVAVVDFVLDDLGGVAREVFDVVDEVLVQILHLNATIASTEALAGKRKTSFARLVGIDLLKNLRVVHKQRLAAVLYADDAFAHTDHVGGEAHALVLMLMERIQEVLPGHGVIGARVFGRQAQKELGFHDGLNRGGLLMSHAFVDF